MKKTKIDYKKLGFFRFREKGKKVLITNDVGGYAFLNKKEFDLFLHNKIEKDSTVYDLLKENNFIADDFDSEVVIEKYKQRKSFITEGPSLHILVITLRCNHQCLYCHASAQSEKKEGVDMSVETVQKALDIIFESTSKTLVIEFQGGEPLLNWSVVKHVITEAKKRNKKNKKKLEFRLVTNLSLMNKDIFEFLEKNDVNICTSLDGPLALHDKNRPVGKISGYKKTSHWIKKINKKYSENKAVKKKLSAIPVVSKNSLKKHKEIIDEYVRQGFDEIFFRPLNPFGISKEKWQNIGYSAVEYIAFYKKALDYIIKLNLSGGKIQEKTAQFYLQKILTDNDPNYLESRSPCGAGIGQIAYNFNGDVYTCDEGRMLSMTGDESFKIGNVDEDSYEDIVTHSTVRTLCTASCLDNLASCSDCVYLPYCGVCPIYNYHEQGNIYAQMAKNERCKISMAILDYLFLKMEDKKIKNILTNWIK